MFNALKIKSDSHQNDETMNEQKTQRFPSCLQVSAPQFPQGKCRCQGSELGGWGSGKPSPVLSEFGSQEVDWQPPSGPLAISGKTPLVLKGTSLSRIILLPKDLDKKSFLDLGTGYRTRSESEGTQTFLPARCTPERGVAWNPSHILGPGPSDST